MENTHTPRHTYRVFQSAKLQVLEAHFIAVCIVETIEQQDCQASYCQLCLPLRNTCVFFSAGHAFLFWKRRERIECARYTRPCLRPSPPQKAESAESSPQWCRHRRRRPQLRFLWACVVQYCGGRDPSWNDQHHSSNRHGYENGCENPSKKTTAKTSRRRHCYTRSSRTVYSIG